MSYICHHGQPQQEADKTRCQGDPSLESEDSWEKALELIADGGDDRLHHHKLSTRTNSYVKQGSQGQYQSHIFPVLEEDLCLCRFIPNFSKSIQNPPTDFDGF